LRVLENSRSVMAIAANPRDPRTVVEIYLSTPGAGAALLPFFSTDGGTTWRGAPPLIPPPECGGLADPSLAWDSNGRVHLLALGLRDDLSPNGIVVYRSSNRGETWERGRTIHSGPSDMHPTLAADTDPAHPTCGNIYAAWDAGNVLTFARSTDSGETWDIAELSGDSWCPEVLLGSSGSVHVAWLTAELGDRIRLLRSDDGAETFAGPVTVAEGVIRLRGALPESNGWPHFPGASFRVTTIPAGACGPDGSLLYAWADYREGVSRIYYRRSTDGGDHWRGPSSGEPLLHGGVSSGADQHDFQPQLTRLPQGELCCTFFEYGPKPVSGDSAAVSHGHAERLTGEQRLIDLVMVVSRDNGNTFSQRMVLSENAWDPQMDVPLPRAGGHGGLAWLVLPGAMQRLRAGGRSLSGSS
jgi:hypothetical protein